MQWPWRKAQTDLDREVQYHLETLADDFERDGLSRKDAMRRARKEFGGVDRVKEECREESRWSWLTQIVQDVRFGWRMMRKTPSITVAAVLSLALGIGATTTILALADGMLWKNVGVPAPTELVEVLWESTGRPELYRGSSGSSYKDGPLRVADFFSRQSYTMMRERLAGKAQIAAHFNTTIVSATYEGSVLVSRMRAVTGNFFQVLQLQPSVGRLFADRDEDPAAAAALVVTDRFYKKHLGGRPDAIDKTITVNNKPYVIAGVLPAAFTGIVTAEETDLYATIPHSAQFLGQDSFYRREQNNPRAWFMQVLARRDPRISESELRSQLDAAFASGWDGKPKSAEVTPHIRVNDASRGLGGVRRQFGDPVNVLLILVGMVLLVACANIANLLLARAAQREKEVALRISLGCGQTRLMRQFFTESVMLAALGGVLSIAVFWILGRLMLPLLPNGFEGLVISFDPNLRIVLATAGVTLLTAVLFGLYPSWKSTLVDAGPALKEGSGSGGTLSRGRWIPARLLVLVQVSLGVLLVTAAILFTSHLNELVHRDTGFERTRVILFDLRPGEIGYQDERLRQFYFHLEDQLASLPGVEAVGLARTRPMRGGGYYDDVRLPGAAKPVGSAIQHGSAGYTTALGVPIIAGRPLTPQEVRGNAKVIVVSEDAVKELGLSSPLGATVHSGDHDYTIVGVAAKARYSRMTETNVVSYLPFPYDRRSVTVVVRTSSSPLALLGAIRKEISGMDRNLPMLDIFTMEQQIARTLQKERMFAWLCGSFGVLALVLCVVGLYGLISHTTARRTPEIGIRMALGASRSDVMQQVLWDGMRLALFGLLLGVPLALYGTNIAEKQRLLPEGLVPYWKLAFAIAVLAVSALAAVLAPAMRASKVEPMKALRQG